MIEQHTYKIKLGAQVQIYLGFSIIHTGSKEHRLKDMHILPHIWLNVPLHRPDTYGSHHQVSGWLSDL